MRNPGVCFRCSGGGKISWNVSAEKRREKTLENQQKRFWTRIADVVAANPEFEIFFEMADGRPHLFASGVHPVAHDILDVLRTRSRELSEGQMIALKKFAEGQKASVAHAADKAAKLEAQKANCRHIGTVGQKIAVTATCVAIIQCESTYGFSQLHIFEDAEGNKLKWFTSSCPGIAKGDTGKLTGTVKAHDRYEDIAQTSVIRVKFAVDSSVAA
jgi:hypothetical protein